MESYNVIGAMSGSSLDGLDVCLVNFRKEGKWTFNIEGARTFELPDSLQKKLKDSPGLIPSQLSDLDKEYGKWIGKNINEFIWGKPKVDLAGVHGHTVYHNPAEKISIQVGGGQQIAETCKIPTVTNFRMADILKGGQGAPLVPVGEYHLFPDYQALVNLGGIANLTVSTEKTIMAWDLAPCNQVFNYLAGRKNLKYDDKGGLAGLGKMISKYYTSLKNLEYFSQSPPKSLGNHWVKEMVLNQLEKIPKSQVSDYLFTYSRFLSDELVSAFRTHLGAGSRILFTGGGTHNRFLMDMIRQGCGHKYEIQIPEPLIIDMKEALIFGFLALLRLRGEVNVFASVTGAFEDTCSGEIHLPD